MKRIEPLGEGTYSIGVPTNDHLLAIGKLIVTFSRFEENIATIMALCYGCEPEVIANIAFGLDFKNRCQMLRGILAYRLGLHDKTEQGLDLEHDEDNKRIARLFKHAVEATERRNLIAHSPWLIEEKTGKPVLVIQKGKQSTGSPGGGIMYISPADIDSDTEFIRKVDEEIWKYFWDNLGAWIQQRAVQGDSGIYSIQPTKDATQ